MVEAWRLRNAQPGRLLDAGEGLEQHLAAVEI
jgi:hypothetical protein